MISITILNRLTVGVSMEVRFIPTAKRFSSLALHDSLLPLRCSIKEKERKKNIVGSPNYVPHNLLLGKNENIFFVTLQVFIDVLEVFTVAEQVFQHRLQSADVGLEEKFGKAVQRAYQCWLKFLPFQDDVLLEIKQKHEQKQWENKFCFNIFFATKILFPLLGGKCLINGDHKHALKKK